MAGLRIRVKVKYYLGMRRTFFTKTRLRKQIQMNEKLNILAIETFYGGSHQDFIDGLIKHSCHEIELFTLSDQFWRWRMKASAVQIAENIDNFSDFDLLFISSLCNIAELKALIGSDCPPIVLYAHENQHAYPKSFQQKCDFHVEWIDFMNTVTADYVVYNSDFHRNAYHLALKTFIENLPNIKVSTEHWITRAKKISSTLYPGTDIPGKKSASFINTSPRIIWNHRWEYDKQPELFLKTLIRCMNAGYKFEIILLGESPPASLRKYKRMTDLLRDRIVHYGYVESRKDYFSLLASGDIVISTAIQENFGLSIVEAIQCGCFPVLPNRLSYPELIPADFHEKVLYQSDKELYKHLTAVLENKSFSDKSLSEKFMVHRWQNRIVDYDNFFRSIF